MPPAVDRTASYLAELGSLDLTCKATGVSTIPRDEQTQLAQRLNLPNVLQTDLIYELLRMHGQPLWQRELPGGEDKLLEEYRRECCMVGAVDRTTRALALHWGRWYAVDTD